MEKSQIIDIINGIHGRKGYSYSSALKLYMDCFEALGANKFSLKCRELQNATQDGFIPFHDKKLKTFFFGGGEKSAVTTEGAKPHYDAVKKDREFLKEHGSFDLPGVL